MQDEEGVGRENERAARGHIKNNDAAGGQLNKYEEWVVEVCRLRLVTR